MAVLLANGRASFVPLTIELDLIPGLLGEHMAAYPWVAKVEAEAANLIGTGFGEAGSAAFVGSVCRWGGYAGIAARVIGNNQPLAKVAVALHAGWAHAQAGEPALGVQAIRQLHSLGWSFASKHLRFLAPASAVILDSVISHRLGYPMTPDGYVTWLADCTTIANALHQGAIPSPRPGGAWRPCDVEAAVFMNFRGN